MRVHAFLGLGVPDMWAPGIFLIGIPYKPDASLSPPPPPQSTLGPTLPAAPGASFKDLLMGIDLEPFSTLQQNKEEGERIIPRQVGEK